MDSKRRMLWRYCIMTAILLIPNLLCLFFAWPGFIQADHQATIANIITGNPSQWHSLVWGYLAVPFMYFTPSYGFYGFVQIAYFVVAVVFSLYRLERAGLLSAKASIVASIFFALFPTFLMYNLLYSSDLIFAYTLLPLTVMLIEISMTRGEALRQNWFIITFGLLLLMAFELRKNAVLIVVFVFIIFVLRYSKIRARLAVLFAAIIVMIAAFSFLFGTVLQARPSASQELLSVPSQQIARAIYDGGDIPDSAGEVIYQIRSKEEWKNRYDPITADPEKMHTALTVDYVKAWFEIGIRNPKSYIRAYLDLMYPFWRITPDPGSIMIGIDFANHDGFTIGKCKDICSKEYLAQFPNTETAAQHWFASQYYTYTGSHFPLVADVVNYVLFNRALPLWTMLVGLFFAIRKRMVTDYLTVTVPLFATLISLLCFAPVPMFRYAAQMYYLLPAVMVYLYRMNHGDLQSQKPRAKLRGAHQTAE
ncbi:UhpB [Bifidobacterium goeldii]|uniref:UhpB n=1 Tax=Bifidobacterium goeldii TaxID=2306975 RepID=A0A430FLF6_9BIFI|nr:DUF6020 family protein [Bifidobacterium goeldii]RSX53686.1 UhpB [Bifidobacterium goeldii]